MIIVKCKENVEMRKRENVEMKSRGPSFPHFLISHIFTLILFTNLPTL